LIIGQQPSRGSQVAPKRGTAEWHALTVGNRAAPPALPFSKIKYGLVRGRDRHAMPHFWYLRR
jgi:hypothetical protein